jgi:DNA-binding response OmpR family regulator
MAATQDNNPPTGPVLTMLRNKGLVIEVTPHRSALFSRLFGDCLVRQRLHTGLQIHVDRGLHIVSLSDRRVEDLAPLPFNLIDYLEHHRERACSRAELIHHLYPNEAQDYDTGYADNRLDTIVARLRKAIEEDPSAPRYILTVRGVGYRLAGGQTSD